MKIALAQMSMATSREQNLQKCLELIHQAQGSDLLLFPEVQLTRFFPQHRLREQGGDRDRFATSLLSDELQQLKDAAKANRLWLSPNLYIKESDYDPVLDQFSHQYYDTSLLINDEGKQVGESHMVHILGCDHFWETDYYEPAPDGFKVFETPWGKIGIVICFDRHLPESIRTCALRGAQLILIPTANLTTEPLEMFEWEVRVQAFQNNVFIAMCNRTGTEDALEFAGQSLVIDPEGEVLYKAGKKEELILCDLDLTLSEKTRNRRPYITLRRPNCYEQEGIAQETLVHADEKEEDLLSQILKL